MTRKMAIHSIRVAKWGLLLAAALFVLAATFLHYFVKSESLQKIVQDKVADSWSRELKIGALELDMLPYPVLKARHVKISNPAWAADSYFLEARLVQVQISLSSLWKGDVQPKNIQLEGVQLNLEAAQDGRNNWQFSGSSSRQETDMDFGHVLVKDALLNIRHSERNLMGIQFEKFEARTDDQLRQVAFDATLRRNQKILAVKGKLKDLVNFTQPGASTEGWLLIQSGPSTATIKGRFPLSLEARNYAFSVAVDAPSLQDAYDFFSFAHKSPIPLEFDMQVQGAGRKLAVHDLRLRMGDMQLQGVLQLDLNMSRPRFEAEVTVNRIDMTQTLLDA